MAVPSISTSVTELPESRVRVEAEVPADEVEKRVAQAARQLGRNLRVPGFRAGKAPPPIIIKRIGREAVLDEAVRDSIAGWYSAAIDAAAIVPVGEPALDLGELPRQGQPLTFSIEIGVRPGATLGDYKGLEVGRREPEADDEAVAAELERLRERSGRLETVERPAASGDFVVIDYLGTRDGEAFAGGEGRDQLVELGSGRLVPGFEDQLAGASAGEERTVSITFPDDYQATDLAGNEAEFAVTVKEVKAKELPPLDDDLAAEAGFDTLDELRADIRERLTEADKRAHRGRVPRDRPRRRRGGRHDRGAGLAVEARSRELWEQMLHTLSHQGISKDTYLRLSGRGEDEIVEQGKEDAERQLKREAVLAAIVAAEGIEPSDDGGARLARARRRRPVRLAQEAARADALGGPARRLQGRARAA